MKKTLDALFLLGVVSGNGDDAVGALDDGHIGVRNGSAHHGAAHLQRGVVDGDAAAVVDDLLDVGAQLDHVVAGILNELAGDGDNPLHQGHPTLNGVGNGFGGGGIAHPGGAAQ